MSIVKVHNKARNITYVYESESYWDKELKQPRSHRKLIGRLDPVTGDIIPTGKRNNISLEIKGSSHSDTNYQALYEEALFSIQQKDAVIANLKKLLSDAEKDLRACHCAMDKACTILGASGKEHIHG